MFVRDAPMVIIDLGKGKALYNLWNLISLPSHAAENVNFLMMCPVISKLYVNNSFRSETSLM